MGQVWENRPAIQDTLSNFAAGAYRNALDSFFTYFGSGNASDTRDELLDATQLSSGKIPDLTAAAKAAGMATPTLVIYSNDFSSSEGAVSNIDVRGVTKTDPTTGQPVQDYTIPVNQFANLALQAGAFQKANIANGESGSILFNPDAIGAMTKNFVASGVSININAGEDGAIYVKDGTVGQHSVTKTTIDFSRIVSKAVDAVWNLRNDPAYASVVYFPEDKPNPDALSNGIPAIAFSGDISDYLAAQAWMIKQFAPKITLSTIFNLWAGNDPVASTIKGNAYNLDQAVTSSVDALNTLGWQKAVPYMDFIAFDKFERDETSGLVLGQKTYDFPRVAWTRALEFYDGLTTHLMPVDKQAIMLWQIPAAGLPSNDPSDAAMLAQGGGSAGTFSATPHFGLTESFFFGDAKLATNGLASAIAMLPTDETAAYFLSKGTTYGEVVTGPDSGWQPATGVIDPVHGTTGPLLDKVFAILWGGGSTSAPISYSGNQWTSLGDPSVQPSSGASFDVKNTYGTATLEILKQISDYKAHVGAVVTPDGEPNVLKDSDLKATTTMVMRAASSAPVTIILNDNGTDDVSFGYFEIDTKSLAIAGSGGENALMPGDSAFAAGALQIAMAHGLIANPGYKQSRDFQIGLDPGKAYGFLIVNQSNVFTSVAAGNLDGVAHIGASSSALLTQTVSFEDRADGGDHDYNDLVVTLLGAHFAQP